MGSGLTSAADHFGNRALEPASLAEQSDMGLARYKPQRPLSKFHPRFETQSSNRTLFSCDALCPILASRHVVMSALRSLIGGKRMTSVRLTLGLFVRQGAKLL